jgi:hypothetical protein
VSSGRASPILCLFDPRQTEEFRRDVELIEPTHPLIQWIRADYVRDGRQLHPISATKLEASKTPTPPGDYVFVVHRWSFVGLRSEHILTYRAISIGAAAILAASASEDLVVAAARGGRKFANAANLVDSKDAYG